MLEQIVEQYPAIRAEVTYAVRQEMAATIEDVLARRIGMQLYSWRDAMEAAPTVGSLLAKELNWSNSATAEAVNAYVGKVSYLLKSAGLSEKKAISMGGPSAAD